MRGVPGVPWRAGKRWGGRKLRENREISGVDGETAWGQLFVGCVPGRGVRKLGEVKYCRGVHMEAGDQRGELGEDNIRT